MNMETLSILQVMHDTPYPPHGGGRVDMWGRLNVLRSFGCDVDVAIATKGILDTRIQRNINQVANNLYTTQRVGMWRGMLSTEPFQVIARSRLRQIEFSHQYDIVLLEAESVAAVLANKTLKYRTLITRTHNIEAEYFKQRSKVENTAMYARLYDRMESKRYGRFTPEILNRSDAIWWVSEEEMSLACRTHPSWMTKSYFLPHYFEASLTQVLAQAKSPTALFIGALSSLQNLEAVEWYLRNVHRHIAASLPDYKLIICGTIGGKDLPESIKQVSQDKTIEVLLDVKDLGPVYKRARVFINPVQHGAGVNSKTIHAIAQGVPVVSTSPGYRGIGLTENQHLLVADDPVTFRSAVIKLLLYPDLGKQLIEKAQEYLRVRYDHKRSMQILLQELTIGSWKKIRN